MSFFLRNLESKGIVKITEKYKIKKIYGKMFHRMEIFFLEYWKWSAKILHVSL